MRASSGKLKFGLSTVAAAALALSALPAAAATNAADAPYLGAGFQYEIPDHARASDNGIGFRIGAGLPLDRFGWSHTALELNFIGTKRSRHSDGKDDYSSFLMFDWVHDFGLFGWDKGSLLPNFKPFVLAGPGVVWDSAHGQTAAHPALDVGAGLLFPLHLPLHGALHRWTQGWAIRTEARLMAQQNHSSAPAHDFLFDWHIGVGLQIPLRFGTLGGAGPTPPPAVAPVKVVPLEGSAPAVLSTPDFDADGVPNAQDKCPNTPPGMKVDAAGCIVSQHVTFPAVQFASASTELDVRAREVLDQLAVALQKHPGAKVAVVGYTDNSGNAQANRALSQRRAQGVVNYLEFRGVEASALSAKGMGEADPIASNATAVGKARNRRVVFDVTVPSPMP
ncbi:MAG TPA: OmpA family protein [Nevskiaceae bacterium]|nr:OmpA family protein [Nevskiaceae bacterium]